MGSCWSVTAGPALTPSRTPSSPPDVSPSVSSWPALRRRCPASRSATSRSSKRPAHEPPHFVMIRTRILGTGRALPPKVLGNDELERLVGTSDSWIHERTGIHERRVLDVAHSTSDLAA